MKASRFSDAQSALILKQGSVRLRSNLGGSGD